MQSTTTTTTLFVTGDKALLANTRQSDGSLPVRAVLRGFRLHQAKFCSVTRGQPRSEVEGILLEVSPEELQLADNYAEVATHVPFHRFFTTVETAVGRFQVKAWVYQALVHADEQTLATSHGEPDETSLPDVPELVLEGVTTGGAQ